MKRGSCEYLAGCQTSLLGVLPFQTADPNCLVDDYVAN